MINRPTTKPTGIAGAWDTTLKYLGLRAADTDERTSLMRERRAYRADESVIGLNTALRETPDESKLENGDAYNPSSPSHSAVSTHTRTSSFDAERVDDTPLVTPTTTQRALAGTYTVFTDKGFQFRLLAIVNFATLLAFYFEGENALEDYYAQQEAQFPGAGTDALIAGGSNNLAISRWLQYVAWTLLAYGIYDSITTVFSTNTLQIIYDDVKALATQMQALAEKINNIENVISRLKLKPARSNADGSNVSISNQVMDDEKDDNNKIELDYTTEQTAAINELVTTVKDAMAALKAERAENVKHGLTIDTLTEMINSQNTKITSLEEMIQRNLQPNNNERTIQSFDIAIEYLREEMATIPTNTAALLSRHGLQGVNDNFKENAMDKAVKTKSWEVSRLLQNNPGAPGLATLLAAFKGAFVKPHEHPVSSTAAIASDSPPPLVSSASSALLARTNLATSEPQPNDYDTAYMVAAALFLLNDSEVTLKNCMTALSGLASAGQSLFAQNGAKPTVAFIRDEILLPSVKNEGDESVLRTLKDSKQLSDFIVFYATPSNDNEAENENTSDNRMAGI